MVEKGISWGILGRGKGVLGWPTDNLRPLDVVFVLGFEALFLCRLACLTSSNIHGPHPLYADALRC